MTKDSIRKNVDITVNDTAVTCTDGSTYLYAGDR